jgi:hypothetical protein
MSSLSLESMARGVLTSVPDLVPEGNECARNSASTSSLSLELHALAVSNACVRISFIWGSLKMPTVFSALDSVDFKAQGQQVRRQLSPFHVRYLSMLFPHFNCW